MLLGVMASNANGSDVEHNGESRPAGISVDECAGSSWPSGGSNRISYADTCNMTWVVGQFACNVVAEGTNGNCRAKG